MTLRDFLARAVGIALDLPLVVHDVAGGEKRIVADFKVVPNDNTGGATAHLAFELGGKADA